MPRRVHLISLPPPDPSGNFHEPIPCPYVQRPEGRTKIHSRLPYQCSCHHSHGPSATTFSRTSWVALIVHPRAALAVRVLPTRNVRYRTYGVRHERNHLTRYDVTVTATRGDGYHQDPAEFALAGHQAASSRSATVVSAHGWPDHQRGQRLHRRRVLGRGCRVRRAKVSGRVIHPLSGRLWPTSCGGS
jgi:hypothetical protein